MKHSQLPAVESKVRRELGLQRIGQLLTAALLGSLVFLTGHARPDSSPTSGLSVASPQAMAEAWTLAEDGQALAHARQPAAALQEFRRAYELSSDPLLLLEVARLEHAVGHLARATDAFERFLDVDAQRVSREHRQVAMRQLRVAAAGTARLHLQTNVQGAEVEIEPERGVTVSDGFIVHLLLDAGERKLSLSKPGYETQTLLAALAPGDVRSLRVDLDKAAGGRSEGGSSKPRWARLAPVPEFSLR